MVLYIKLLNLLAIESSQNKVKIETYYNFMYELMKFMNHFGKTISIAFADIKWKANTVVGNRDELLAKGLIKRGSDETIYINSFLHKEMELGIVRLNGSNNQKVLGGRYPELKNYVSTGWMILRGGGWLFEYVYTMFSMIGNQANTDMVKTIVQAYEVSLMKYHPWIVARAAKLGMYTVSSKPVFIQTLIDTQNQVGNNYTEAKFYSDFAVCAALLKQTSDHLWKFLRENQIDDIE